MPPKLANLKPRIVIRALQKGGFYIHQQTGEHVHLKHPTKPGRVTVPCHQRFDLPKAVVRDYRGILQAPEEIVRTPRSVGRRSRRVFIAAT